MSAPKWFDTDAELQKLREPPPKEPDVPEAEDDVSHFSHFRWGRGTKSENCTRQIRPFLPRPLGQEEALNPFIVWEGLFLWLIENHPAHFRAICDAEDEIVILEQQGIATGPQYEEACERLRTTFEAGRRLKLTQGVKIRRVQ